MSLNFMRKLSFEGEKFDYTQSATRAAAVYENYNRSNSTKSPASDAGNVSEPRLM
jgi:hypothetical protein